MCQRSNYEAGLMFFIGLKKTGICICLISSGLQVCAMLSKIFANMNVCALFEIWTERLRTQNAHFATEVWCVHVSQCWLFVNRHFKYFLPLCKSEVIQFCFCFFCFFFVCLLFLFKNYLKILSGPFLHKSVK